MRQQAPSSLTLQGKTSQNPGMNPKKTTTHARIFHPVGDVRLFPQVPRTYARCCRIPILRLEKHPVDGEKRS